MRPTVHTLRLLEDRARYLGERKTALAERYVAEGLEMDEHPGIHFVEAPMGRRPAVMGCGLDVWEIVKVVRDNEDSVEDAAAYLEVDPELVHSALRYYGSNRREIDDWIRRVEEFNRREHEKWLRAQQGVAAAS